MENSERTRPIEETLKGVFENYTAASVSKIAKSWFGKKVPSTKVSELIPIIIDKIKLPHKKDIERICIFSDAQRSALIIAQKGISILKLLSLLQSMGYTDVREGIYELICKGFMLVDRGESYGKVDFSRQGYYSFLKEKFNIITLPSLKKMISAPSVGASQSNFDDRAKNAGFHKLQKLGKGEYEKQY